MPAPPVGLDITATTVSVVVLKKHGKQYAVQQHVVVPLEHGIVVDGEVRDVALLAEKLKVIWAEHNIKGKRVSIGLANQRCITRLITMNKTKGRHLRDAVLFEMGDHLPIPIEEAVVDFQNLGMFTEPETGIERQRCIAVAVYKETAELFRDAVEDAGLTLTRIDLSAFAVMRTGLGDPFRYQLAAPVEGMEMPDTALAMCDISTTHTNVVIVKNGMCELNRMISFGSQGFTDALVENFGWSAEDSRRVQFEAGVLPLGGVESPGDPYIDARRVMQYAADQLANELQNNFQFYMHGTEQAVPVTHVILSGEGALLRGIEQRIASELQIPVSIIDASPRLIQASVEQLGASHANLAVALGLAMEDAA